jgi:two-component system KDP operon response regulator KdpE
MRDRDSSTKILLIEDDVGLAEFMQVLMQREGYDVRIAHHGEEGLRLAQQWQPHLVVLDIMLPEMDGWAVCQRLRETSNVPIIFTTALSAERDVVRGLEMGADDYLIKPFGPKELIARIQAVLRRHAQPQPRSRVYQNGRLIVDMDRREVQVNGTNVTLTPIEYKLLACLVENEDKVMSHETLLSHVWGQEYAQDRRYLKLYIWYLRQKIEVEPARPRLIVTERGVGYRLARANSTRRTATSTGAR